MLSFGKRGGQAATTSLDRRIKTIAGPQTTSGVPSALIDGLRRAHAGQSGVFIVTRETASDGYDAEIYCVFPAERVRRMMSQASQLASAAGVRAEVHDGNQFANDLLSYAGRNGVVIGDRRLRRR